MAKILFFIKETSSHLNASCPIAKSLQRQGHDICYIRLFGPREKYKRFTFANGFDYHEIELPNMKLEKQSIFSRIKPLLKRILKKKAFTRQEFLSKRKNYLSKKKIFSDAILQLEPDLIVIDVHFSLEAAILKLDSPKTRMAILCTTLQLDQAAHIPPLTSKLKYTNRQNFISAICVKIAWQFYYVKRKFLLENLLGVDDISIIKQRTKTQNIPLKRLISINRTFKVGLQNIPEIITAPKELDFPRTSLTANRYYAGTHVNFDRKVLGYDWKYKSSIVEICKQKELNNQYLVYCSLGSINTEHASIQTIVTFFKRVIEAFKKENDFLLVLSIGQDIDFNYFEDPPSNVYIFQSIPQIDLLKKADLMITHGGMQSITECILFEVPMVVYPLNARWDQNGNSARVLYHKIGVRGNIKRDRPLVILQKTKRLIHNSTYKKRITKMRNSILTQKKDLFGHQEELYKKLL